MKTALLSYCQNGFGRASPRTSEGEVQLIASAELRLLREAGLEVSSVSSTGFLDPARVKTLHPLFMVDSLNSLDAHLEELRTHQIDPIDIVVCNYPF